MTQEDKDLLLKDLCARLLYKPKVLVNGHLATILGIDENVVIVCIDGNDYKDETVVSADNNGDDIKPYLRPLSSMTKEEEKEVCKIEGRLNFLCKYIKLTFSIDELDWLNAHHFDYRGLIDKELALEAPDGMYKTKED